MQMPSRMRALEAASQGVANLKLVTTRSVPWPAPAADASDVLVKIEYTALNPVDWCAAVTLHLQGVVVQCLGVLSRQCDRQWPRGLGAGRSAPSRGPYQALLTPVHLVSTPARHLSGSAGLMACSWPPVMACSSVSGALTGVTVSLADAHANKRSAVGPA